MALTKHELPLNTSTLNIRIREYKNMRIRIPNTALF
jgi:hypothetical protein